MVLKGLTVLIVLTVLRVPLAAQMPVAPRGA